MAEVAASSQASCPVKVAALHSPDPKILYEPWAAQVLFFVPQVKGHAQSLQLTQLPPHQVDFFEPVNIEEAFDFWDEFNRAMKTSEPYLRFLAELQARYESLGGNFEVLKPSQKQRMQKLEILLLAAKEVAFPFEVQRASSLAQAAWPGAMSAALDSEPSEDLEAQAQREAMELMRLEASLQELLRDKYKDLFDRFRACSEHDEVKFISASLALMRAHIEVMNLASRLALEYFKMDPEESEAKLRVLRTWIHEAGAYDEGTLGILENLPASFANARNNQAESLRQAHKSWMRAYGHLKLIFDDVKTAP